MASPDTEKSKQVAIATIGSNLSKSKDVDFVGHQNPSRRCCGACCRVQEHIAGALSGFFSHPENAQCEYIPQKYSYIFRKKSRWELTLISAAVCGIEFCYAAETAFVTPVLLSLGLSIKFVTMIWCLSPLLAFFLTPLLGSLSDSCKSRFGRRRPFIFTLSIGILIGLFLVPYGRHIGYLLGDRDLKINEQNHVTLTNFTSLPELNENIFHNSDKFPQYYGNENALSAVSSEASFDEHHDKSQSRAQGPRKSSSSTSHVQTWSVVFTVIGTILIDLCADVCQSPCRAYLLDISVPGEQAAGLSTFSLMAGLGASLGYVIGAIRWDVSVWGNMLEGQVIVVFSIITIVFLICLTSALCSFPEVPLSILEDPVTFKEYQEKVNAGSEMSALDKKQKQYSSIAESSLSERNFKEDANMVAKMDNQKRNSLTTSDQICKNLDSNSVEAGASNSEHTSLKEYLKSIIHMPKSLRILCITNLFCWMSIICYCLYFTDFVGEYVYRGDPNAPENSEEYERYKDGVRFGCWGMALSSLFCSFYSLFVEDLVKRFGAKTIYVSGGIIYAVGMIIMALSRHPVAVIVLSATPGVMYTTVFTMPYLLVAHYHSKNKFSKKEKGGNGRTRGIGTDVATVTSMLVLSQLILSLSMGSVVEAVGSNVVIVYGAAIFSVCAAVSASQVMYFDM